MIPRIPLHPSDQSDLCRVSLGLGSVMKLTALLGLGNGIVSVLIAFFLALIGVKKYAEMSVSMALLFCALGPLIGALQGMLLGLFGFPLYRFVVNRRDGQTLRGNFITLRIGAVNFRRDHNPNQPFQRTPPRGSAESQPSP